MTEEDRDETRIPAPVRRPAGVRNLGPDPAIQAGPSATPRRLTRAPVPIEADLPPRHFRFTIRGLMGATLAVAILLSLPRWISIPLTFAAIFAPDLAIHAGRRALAGPSDPHRAGVRWKCRETRREPVHEGNLKPTSTPLGVV